VSEHVGIAGSGAIACGLAATAARNGSVVLWARSDASRDRALAAIAKSCERLGEDHPAENVTVTTTIEDLAAATFVVEAIAEDLAHKSALLEQLGTIVADDAILASTTSSLPVGVLAAVSGRPDRFAALHVFNPVPKMKLVELCFTDAASDDTRARTLALCEDLEKTVVEVPDVPGFVVNRLLFPYLFSAVTLMEETGLEAEAVDVAMTLGTGHPMGPLALLDFVGLDVSIAIGETIGADIPQTVRDLAADGALGRKAKRGFYDYAPAPAKA
jgi:3-hydroxybutyryl-CoA dehydrogenase